MKSRRGWILGVAAGYFAAGMALGLVLPDVIAACSTDVAADEPNEHYVRQLTADYGLDDGQQRLVRIVLTAAREEERAVFQRADFARLPAELQAQLNQTRRQEQLRIRQVLDARQRALFDAHCGAGQGGAGAGGAPGGDGGRTEDRKEAR